MSSTATSQQSFCARIVDRLVQSVGQQRYRMWFDRSAKLNYHDAPPRLEVAVPNQFVADWIGRHFQHALRDALDNETQGRVDLDLCVDPSRFDQDALRRTERAVPVPRAAPRKTTPPNRMLRHRLEAFVVGPSNELAYNAAQRLTERGQSGPNPLFIHGGCGLGKTHLLQGICRRTTQQQPDARVLYTTAEQFTNDFLASVRTNRNEAFRRRIRDLDLLAVDDVHFLANKQATQQEFLHSFDAIQLSGAHVALASDNHPKLIHQFSEQLVSRCIRGMVVEVRPPDTDTRVRIIRSLAADRGLSLLESVIEALANHCRGSVREIEGTLTKLHALATLAEQQKRERNTDARIGHALLTRLLETELDASPKLVRIDTILRVVCDRMCVSKQQLQSRSRLQHIVLSRALVILLARRLTSMSFPEIAAELHRNGHSTAVTAARRLKKQLAEDLEVTVPSSMETMKLSDLFNDLTQSVRRMR